MVFAILLKFVQGRIIGLELRSESLFDDLHGDHIIRGFELFRGIHDALMEYRLRSNLSTLEASLVPDNKHTLGQRSLHVCVVRLGCPPGIRAGLGVRSQEIKVQVDQRLDFTLQYYG